MNVRFQQTFFFDIFGCARHSPSKLALCTRLHENSRHGKVRVNSTLLIWLDENVHIHAPFLDISQYLAMPKVVPA